MKPALEAGTQAWHAKRTSGNSRRSFFYSADEFRTTAAQLIDCSPIARPSFLGQLRHRDRARNLPVKKGQSILVLEEQFPSNYYPWQRRAERNRAVTEDFRGPKS